MSNCDMILSTFFLTASFLLAFASALLSLENAFWERGTFVMRTDEKS